MTVQEFIESGLAECYVLGVTTAEETRLVERMILQYPELKLEIEQIQVTLEGYVKKHALSPDPSLREKIIAKIEGTHLGSAKAERNVGNPIILPVTPHTSTVPAFWRAVAGIALILLAGSIVTNFIVLKNWRNSSGELAALRSEKSILAQKATYSKLLADSVNKSLVAYKNQHQTSIAELASLYKPSIIALKTASHPEQKAVIFWCNSTRIVHIDPGTLPVTDAGKQYQLWAFVEGQPVSVGIFDADPTNKLYSLARITEAEGFAVTLEKAGGVASPEGPVVVKASL